MNAKTEAVAQGRCVPSWTVMGSWWLALMLGLLGSAVGAKDAAAVSPGTPRQMADLRAAVADHERGRWRRAEQRFELLARQGVAAADHNLVIMHLRRQSRGRPHATSPTARDALARRHMERAAQGGFVTAQFEWAQMLDQGIAGPKDVARAVPWYERAAMAGSADAQVAAGTAHYLGRGTPRDGAKAFEWYRQAALQGDVGAQYMFASMAEAGDGGQRDLSLAKYWYAAAAANGDVAAAAKANALALPPDR